MIANRPQRHFELPRHNLPPKLQHLQFTNINKWEITSELNLFLRTMLQQYKILILIRSFRVDTSFIPACPPLALSAAVSKRLVTASRRATRELKSPDILNTAKTNKNNTKFL